MQQKSCFFVTFHYGQKWPLFWDFCPKKYLKSKIPILGTNKFKIWKIKGILLNLRSILKVIITIHARLRFVPNTSQLLFGKKITKSSHSDLTSVRKIAKIYWDLLRKQVFDLLTPLLNCPPSHLLAFDKENVGMLLLKVS